VPESVPPADRWGSPFSDGAAYNSSYASSIPRGFLEEERLPASVAGEQPSSNNAVLGPRLPDVPVEPSIQSKVSSVFLLGWGFFVVGAILLLIGLIAWATWVTPTGLCYSGFGQSIPCPAVELTPNDSVGVLVGTLGGLVVIAMGLVLVCLAWLHQPASSKWPG